VLDVNVIGCMAPTRHGTGLYADTLPDSNVILALIFRESVCRSINDEINMRSSDSSIYTLTVIDDMEIESINKSIIGVLLGLLLSILTPASAQQAYPINPVVTADYYFLSGQGITRFDRSSGSVDWQVLGREQLHEPVLARETIITGGAGGVFAIDQEDGHVHWRQNLGSPAFSPVLTNGIAYVATQGGRLLALSEVDGMIRWSKELSDEWVYPPALGKGLLVTGGGDALVWGLDDSSGELRWQHKLDQELVYSPVSASEHSVIVTTFSGAVIALKIRDGSEIWSRHFTTQSLAPTVIDSRVLLPGMDGILRALDPDTGRLLWQQPLDGRIVTPLHGRGDLLLALTEEGTLYLLGADSGKIRHRERIEGSPLGCVFLEKNAVLVFMSRGNKSDPYPVLVKVDM